MSKLSCSVVVVAIAAVAMAGCRNDRDERQVERWAVTHNTNVAIDWDKISEAYKKAEGPEDFEKRVNEIYEGSDIVSVSVQDESDTVQVVTGFFDKNSDGAVQDPEKIFSIKRSLQDSSNARYQIAGHGHYRGYHSPFWTITSSMMMGAMVSRMFMPSYRPMYRSAYVTSPARSTALRSSRGTYRAKNPSRFSNRAKASRSGRKYGAKGGSFGSSGRGTSPRRRRTPRRRFGGGRFGIRSRGSRKRIRLDA